MFNRFAAVVGAALLVTACASPAAVNLTKYGQIQDGMTVAEVDAIMGKKGDEMARSGSGENEFVTVTWKNSDGTNMTATFQGGKLKGKAQIGLK